MVTMGFHGHYTTEKVTYPSHGETITGVLYKPHGVANPPGIVVLGPYSFVKEQAPLQYATRLADEGYAALIFDPRTVGESTGQPRRLENPVMENEDVVSGIDYLVSRGDVDAKRLFLVGVCQAGPECLDVASYYPRTDVWMICSGCVNVEPDVDLGSLKRLTPEQGEALYQARIQRAKDAKALYEKTGKVIYQPLVDPKAADPNIGSLAGLPGPVTWSWYGPWTMKGFENRCAIMSDLDHFGYSTVAGVAKLTKPALVIHGNNCMNAAAAKRHFESILTKKKKLIWDDEISHFQHYEQPDVVDRNESCLYECTAQKHVGAETVAAQLVTVQDLPTSPTIRSQSDNTAGEERTSVTGQDLSTRLGYSKNTKGTLGIVSNLGVLGHYSALSSSPENLSVSTRAFPALLLQVLALALQFHPDQNDEALEGLKYAPDIDFTDLAADYSDVGHQIVSMLGSKDISLTKGQAELMEAFFEKSIGSVIESWHTLGRAIRDAQKLGLHRTFPLERKLWLVLHLWDAHMAVVLSSPIASKLGSNFVPSTSLIATSPPQGFDDVTISPFDFIVCGYYAAYKYLQDIHDLEIENKGAQEAVQNIHNAVINNISKLPAWAASSSPALDGKYPWLPAARETLITEV
ncbi:hypothetical protein CSAL01_12290 [Colletotrichum salicis]|uniref:Xylanolytic transcriptional activator regulatory domain-containing protein n=1 Tax=Colletotrichum salicis TaxID=1209931 RepID=A0A135V7H3_9PEZI|nr:hypothetical protein CSAL01_12290 [Colletotrichum salicis]